jgi:hypothetical protein
MATYADDARQYAWPGDLLAAGGAAIRARMAERLADPTLHAHLVHRVVSGCYVVDHELVSRRIDGVATTVELLATYEVRQGRIVRATFLQTKP